MTGPHVSEGKDIEGSYLSSEDWLRLTLLGHP